MKADQEARAESVEASSLLAQVGRRLKRGAALILGVVSAPAAELSPEGVEFFEAKIRPILVAACYQCHSAEAGKSKGGLVLDSPAGWRRGGGTGPAIVAGDPGKSLLIEAVRHTSEDLQMPPAEAGGKLSVQQIALLEEWVRMGAPDPRGEPVAPRGAAASHWAFQPVARPAVPAGQAREIATPVDAFVRARQREKRLTAAPAAEARTLLRRVSYDLTGLPPSPEDMEAFVRDYGRDAAAYARVVERLLATPAYGERWGRFWLDVARYADTQGYLVGNAERRFAYAHTYRDYVIRAFNEDRPFDRFIVEQLAADRLPLGEDKSALAALGFLTLGRRFLGNQNDIIDDRIDVVTRGLMGLTVTCARCHDHKYDPISMPDYYALHGVFASSEEPAEKPLLQPLADTPAYRDFLRKRSEVEAKVKERERSEVAKFLAGLRSKTGDYLLGAHEAAALAPGEKFELFAGTRKLNPEVLRRWQAYLGAPERRQGAEPLLEPWWALAALPVDDFAGQARALIAEWKMVGHSEIVDALAAAPERIAALRDVAAVYNEVVARAEKEPAPAAVRAWTNAADFPANLGPEAAATMIRRQLNDKTAALRRDLEALNWTEPGAPVRAMALVDRAQPRNSPVLLRGNPASKGPEVPRRFLAVLAGENAVPFGDGSGRLELARAIATRANPLTARVFVNRVWGWHFGAALVDTPSDFGVRTEVPVQRELLEWLADYFMTSGWSVKALHRVIVLSHTYRQASLVSAADFAADPENRYLTRFNRRRLEFEALRDTLLVAAGRLESRAGGISEDLLKEPFSRRRTVYGFIDRQNLPGMFRTFDFPNPDVSSAQRFATTVPQQALFLLNSPFVLEQARALAERAQHAGGPEPRARVEALYRWVHQRMPDEAERAEALTFVQHPAVVAPAAVPGDAQPAAGSAPVASAPALDRWAALAQVLLLSNETAFVD